MDCSFFRINQNKINFYYAYILFVASISILSSSMLILTVYIKICKEITFLVYHHILYVGT